jgi:hypothetical protein
VPDVWCETRLYTPKTAEDLAVLRATRERTKAEREERKFQEENPLLAWLERSENDATEG